MASKISRSHTSVKHEIIDRTNSKTLISVAIATFVVIFCAFAVRALVDQSMYYRRVITDKETALEQLKSNREALEDLEVSYQAFTTASQNVLGGNPAGDGPIDGPNAGIVLDALPSKYDYPALSSSFEKLLRDGGYEIGSIGGTEDASLAQLPAVAEPTTTEVPYSFSFTATTDRTRDLLQTLERSIRPMHIDSLRISVSETSLTTNVSLHTYFAQEKIFELGKKEVR